MEISLIAKLKNYDDFIENYKMGDENKTYNGKSLLFYSLSNANVESRYRITIFLLDKGANPNVSNECNENLLHILFSRTNYDIKDTAELCCRFIEAGVDINQIDEKGRVPIQYLIMSKYSDDDLEPIYDVLLSKGDILLNHKNAWGKTPLELVNELSYRDKLLERLDSYGK